MRAYYAPLGSSGKGWVPRAEQLGIADGYTQLAETVAALPEAEWTTFDTDPDGTQRQWAEVVYVPTKKSEHKHLQPLRRKARDRVAT